MAKRIKKPPVKPETRRQWLRRHEEEGESPPQIASRDGFDVRTVRRQIELGRLEREAREARLAVLRSAMESHYRDLCAFAEKLDVEVAREERIPTLLREDRMWSALRQHLPRSPLWSYLGKWDNLQEELSRLQSRAEARLREMVGSDPRLVPVVSGGAEGVIPGIVGALAFQTRTWARGLGGLAVKEDLRAEGAEEGLVNLRYGFSQMGKVKRQYVRVIRKVVADAESKVVDWEEYRDFRKLFGELERLRRSLRDELAIITLRRIVPGRCKYCPL